MGKYKGLRHGTLRSHTSASFLDSSAGGGKDNPRCAIGHLHLGLRTLGKLAGRLLRMASSTPHRFAKRRRCASRLRGPWWPNSHRRSRTPACSSRSHGAKPGGNRKIWRAQGVGLVVAACSSSDRKAGGSSFAPTRSQSLRSPFGPRSSGGTSTRPRVPNVVRWRNGPVGLVQVERHVQPADPVEQRQPRGVLLPDLC